MATATLSRPANVASDSPNPASRAESLIRQARKQFESGLHAMATSDARQALVYALRWKFVSSTGHYSSDIHDPYRLISRLRSLDILRRKDYWRVKYLAETPHSGDDFRSHFEAIIALAERLLRVNHDAPYRYKPTRPDARPMSRKDVCNVEPIGHRDRVKAVGLDKARWTITEGGDA